jgi:hypothetical protein
MVFMTTESGGNPASGPPPAHPRSLWKPIGITLLSSLILAICTCGGGFTIGKGPDGLGTFLLLSGLVFLGILAFTAFFAVIYFFIWLAQR